MPRDQCDVCGREGTTWPVAIDGNTDDIRELCNGCAACHCPDAAAVIDMLEKS